MPKQLKVLFGLVALLFAAPLQSASASVTALAPPASKAVSSKAEAPVIQVQQRRIGRRILRNERRANRLDRRSRRQARRGNRALSSRMARRSGRAYRKSNRLQRRAWRRGYYRGYRGYRRYRRGYRRWNDGFWYPPAAFVVVGAAPRVYYRDRYYRGYSARHHRWCENRYRSYRRWDGTYQPYHGPRRRCNSPFDGR